MKKLIAIALTMMTFAACLDIDDSAEPKTSTTESSLTICDTEPGILCPIPSCEPTRCNKTTHCYVCVHCPDENCN